MQALIAVAVFVCAVALDFAYVRLQIAIARRAAHAGARWSVIMCALSSVSYLALARASAWYILPECLGLYVGFVTAMRRSHPA